MSLNINDQSHYIEVVQRGIFNKYGTKNDIMAGFGPAGSTEKKLGADYE